MIQYQIHIVHYQLVTIYPFEDGNGRVRRLLIILYLSIYKSLIHRINNKNLINEKPYDIFNCEQTKKGISYDN